MDRIISTLLMMLAGGRAVRHAAHGHHAPLELIYAEIGANLKVCPQLAQHANVEKMRWQLPIHVRAAGRSKTEEGTHCLQVFVWEPTDTGTYKFEGFDGGSWSSRQEFLVVPMRQHRVWLVPGETKVRFLPKDVLTKIATVIWYRSDHDVAECHVSHDGMKTCNYDDAFKNRAVLNVNSGELTLTETEQSDYGVSFTLRVNDELRKWKDQFTILIVPVLEVEIEVGETLHLDPEFTPQFVGGSISEIARIKWTNGHDSIENTDTTLIDTDNGELTIPNWKPPSRSSIFTNAIYDDRVGKIMKMFKVVTIVRLQADVGTVLCLDPEFTEEINNITWKYGVGLAVEYTNGVDVNYHGAFDGASSLTTTSGKLMVNNWKPGDIFTVEINGEFMKRIVVEGVVRVEIGTTLYLDPKFSGKINSIVWNHGDKSAVESNDGVNLAYYGAHKHTSKMIPATGKLMVSDWKPFNDAILTVDINAGEFTAVFNVENTIRVELSGDLSIDLGFVEEIKHMTWMFNGKKFAEFDRDNGPTFPEIGCAVDGSWDPSTSKLTARSWKCDGEFSVDINDDLKTTISVVTNVVYIAIGGQQQSDPKHYKNIENSIVWKNNGNVVVADSKWDNVTVSIADGKLAFSSSYFSVDGLIKVEINGKTMPQSFVAVGVRKLDTYEGLQMTLGDCADFATTRKCELICNGDVEGAEPVKYFWKQYGRTTWIPGTKHMQAAYAWGNFAFDECSMRNPVSELILSTYR